MTAAHETDSDILEHLQQELNVHLIQQDFNVITQGGNGYALDEQGHVVGLNLHNLDLQRVPSQVWQFQHLAGLSLFNNHISEFPPELFDCLNIQKLSLSHNQITSLPADITRLTQLQYLDLTGNRLKALPEAITALGLEILWDSPGLEVKGILLEENPLETPPVEIVKQGRKAVMTYFDSLHEARCPNEVKVLLVGEGEAGKTSLVRRLFGEDFQQDEKQTQGITIRSLKYRAGDDAITTRFWDFGGQEIMHATHQFFLSKRSVYVLVLDGRKDEKAEYWLKLIELFGGKSPILVVLNKMDQHPGFDVNRRFLQNKYQGIRNFYPMSCATGEGVMEFVEGLIESFSDVELLQTTWPVNWFRVKTALENREETEHVISYEAYLRLCQQENILDREKQETLLQFLNDLGVILHFTEFGLNHTGILDPTWLTEAVYKIITSRYLAQRKGVLPLNNIEDILQQHSPSDYYYPRDTYMFILELMKKFEICYELEDRQTILVPDLLPVQEPFFRFEYDEALRFVIHYDVLPRSVMPRFIVNMHKDIKGEFCWRTGVVLEDTMFQAIAVVKADHEARKIFIYVCGAQHKREFFTIIYRTLKTINQSFTRLKYDERICLPDNPDITVSYAHLLKMESQGIETFFPEGAEKVYRVKDLLGTIFIENRNQEEINRILREFVRQFQASLEKLRHAREDNTLTEDEFVEKLSELSSTIEVELPEADQENFETIEARLLTEFSYLKPLLDTTQNYGKYRLFLLNAEYFYSCLLHGLEIDGAAIILEYAKIVDAILYDYVGEPLIRDFKKHDRRWEGFTTRSNRPTLPNTLGAWELLTHQKCLEYQQWIATQFSKDLTLCHFLTAEVYRHTNKIRNLRNEAAHGKLSHGADTVKIMREILLSRKDSHHKTLMEWCIEILQYPS